MASTTNFSQLGEKISKITFSEFSETTQFLLIKLNKTLSLPISSILYIVPIKPVNGPSIHLTNLPCL